MFLRWSLETQHAHLLNQVSTAGHGTRKLDIDRLREVKIPLPPPRLQKEFATRVSEVCALQAQQAASRRRLDDLFQSMLHSAFQGDLSAADAPELHLAIQPSGAEYMSRRVTIACYIVNRLHASPTFGRTQLVKGLYMAESLAALDLHGEYERQAAGPFDKSIYDIEKAAEAEHWFAARETRTQRGHPKINYSPFEGIKQKILDAIALLGEERDKLDCVLALFKQRTTKDVEILTTLYAAWNDLLIVGDNATDDDIVDEVLRNWHEDKKQVPETRWRREIQWMRTNSLVPTGRGRPTRKTQ